MIRRWLASLLLAAGALLALALVTGFLWQRVAEPRERAALPHSGRLLDVAGHKLYLQCEGEGSPTVVLESGLGVPLAGWNLVIPEVRRFTRVCAYDRAGYGLSEAGPLPRTSGHIALELHVLLRTAGLAPPYLLVGHSIGGYHIRVFTHQFPDEVAGLVFLDASHQDQERWESPTMRKAQQQELSMIGFARYASEFGIHRLLLRLSEGASLASFRRVPGAVESTRIYQRQRRFLEAVSSELAFLDESARQVRASGTLGNRPVLVVTAARPIDQSDLVPGVTLAEMRAFQQVWQTTLQPSIARLSTRGEQRFAPASGHMIPFEDPRSAITAIRDVVTALRTTP